MTMGLTWQQAPHGPNPAGRFLSANPIPEHVLYAEPAGRRMRVELAGAVVAASDVMKERASAPGGCWKLASIRLHQAREAHDDGSI
jgi:hypothetical protein